MAQGLSPVSWEAEEYIVKDRNAIWYICLFVVAGGLGVLAYFLKAWTFLALIVLSVIAILVSNLRPPRKLHYTLNNDSLKEGQHTYPYKDFKAFGILKESGHFSAVLIPKKRFGIQAKVYFPEGSGEAIVDLLGAHLPMEEVRLDILDRIANFLRI